MLKAQLGNEFGNPVSKEYKAREEAFCAYNSLVEKMPETVANVMSRLALDETIDKSNRLESVIEHAALNVLDTTNHGTQIGIALPAREATWAQVFEDERHRQAAADYHALHNKPEQSSDIIAACRRRGLETLKVVAHTHISTNKQHGIPPGPFHSLAA